MSADRPPEEPWSGEPVDEPSGDHEPPDGEPFDHGAGRSGSGGPGAADALPESGPGSLAPVWARAIARVVDLFLVFSAASMVLNLTGVIEVVDEEVTTTNPLVALLVLVGVWGLYEVGGTVGQNRMVGKMLMGLRVRAVEADRPPAPGRVVARWLLPSVLVLVPLGSFQFFAVAMVYLSAVLTPRLQGFHDRLAHTLVVRSR